MPSPTARSSLVAAFAGRLAVLIYGFEDPQRPLSWLIEAFEAVAARMVSLGPRQVAPLASLVHPVFAAGKVYAWEVLTAAMTATSPRTEPMRLIEATQNPGPASHGPMPRQS